MCIPIVNQKKKNNNNCATPPPRGLMAPLMSQNCTRLAEEISQNLLKVEA